MLFFKSTAVANVRYCVIAILMIVAVTHSVVIASDLKNKSALANSAAGRNAQSALDLYNQHKYAAAASAFENIIKTSTPNQTLYYYAALANQQSGQVTRANQLFKYLVTTFPGTQEAAYAQKVLLCQQSSPSQTEAEESELPESVKNLLPEEMQYLLKTEEGKRIVRQALKEQGTNVQRIREAEKRGVLNTSTPYAKIQSSTSSACVEHPFTAQDIARDGAGGIDQGRNPNCWFEASISSLAQLPRGQKLLADTIRSKQGNKYIVRFHNDGVEYIISQEDLNKNGIHDKALWASLIECAELKKFPNNEGANGANDDQSRLEIGLGSITGHKAEVVSPVHCEAQELSSFIGSAIKSQNPIVAATYGEDHLASMPEILVPSHAYTIIDFDPAKSTVTLRNPHGRKSEMFSAPPNSIDIEFQQLGDGVIKVGLATFQKYFHSIARSFI